MKNSYGLPKAELQMIFDRDKACVYCKKLMLSHNAGNVRSDWYSIEHLNYLSPWNNPATVTISCWSCNSSRGNKKIRDWFTRPYCLERSISLDTVSEVVRKYILEVEDKE